MDQVYDEPKQLQGSDRMPAPATVTDAEGASIKNTMLQKLGDEAIAAGWDPGTVVKESMILVCPMPDRATYSPRADERTIEYESQKMAGWYVVEAVKEVLQLDSAVRVDTDYQGLLVDYARGSVQKLRNKWHDQEMQRPDELVGYVELASPSLQGDWRIRV